MPPRRRLAVVPPEPDERAPDLRDAVKSSIGAMSWLTDSDAALKSLAMRIAEEIETTIDRARELDDLYPEFRGLSGGTDAFKRLERLQAMCDITKTVASLAPQLQGVLRDLGGTPAARAAMKADKPVGGRLAQLRDSAASGQHNT